MTPQHPNDVIKLQEMVRDGEVVIVPAGFRCFTKMELFKTLRIGQPSLPFDNGFFPPETVGALLEKGTVDLAWPSFNEGHAVCKKYENYSDKVLGKGIKFVRSSYAEIDALANDRSLPNINQYLDATFGYYTLDANYRFVLAHYNWHKFASIEQSGGMYDPQLAVRALSDLLTKRMERLYYQCTKAQSVIFVVGETQGYDFMMIDEEHFDLRNSEIISYVANKKFDKKCHVVSLADVASPGSVFDIIRG
jgi:hypothetical protein